MGDKHIETCKSKDLRKDDIIRMRIPFEENTSDYYNGYQPKEIRGQLFKDRFGDTSKPRFVIVVGQDQNSIVYLPLTSRHSKLDKHRHYVLQDNDMTWKKNPDMKSYVETSALRSVYANPEWDIGYIGHVAENDMVNIMVKLGKNEIDFDSKRDQRAYVSRTKEEKFEKTLKNNGYTLSKNSGENFEKTYVKEDGRMIIKQKWGLVKYHVPLSKEEVTKMVAKREGKPVDDFVKAIADITEKSIHKESGVAQ